MGSRYYPNRACTSHATGPMAQCARNAPATSRRTPTAHQRTRPRTTNGKKTNHSDALGNRHKRQHPPNAKTKVATKKLPPLPSPPLPPSQKVATLGRHQLSKIRKSSTTADTDFSNFRNSCKRCSCHFSTYTRPTGVVKWAHSCIVIADACGEEHIQSPAGRNRGGGRAGTASARAETPPGILPQETSLKACFCYFFGKFEIR